MCMIFIAIIDTFFVASSGPHAHRRQEEESAWHPLQYEAMQQRA